MPESGRRVYVVTAGTSLGGNLFWLGKAIEAASESGGRLAEIDIERRRWIEFVNTLLRYIDSGPRQEPDWAPTAHRLIGSNHEKNRATTDEPGAAHRDANRADAKYPPADSAREFYTTLNRSLDRPSEAGGTAGLSAELSSLFADGAPAPDNGDHILLLASDSGAGVRSAQVVANILCPGVGGDVATVRADQGSGARSTLLERVPSPGVTVAVVGGLRARDALDIDQSAVNLATVIGSAFNAARDSEATLIVHPIGGFKALIPLLTALVAHLPVSGVQIEMWSNHEFTTTGLPLSFLRVGVPEENAKDLNRLAREGAVNIGELTDSRWRDYAWYVTGDRAKLTTVGQGIVRLYAVATGNRTP